MQALQYESENRMTAALSIHGKRTDKDMPQAVAQDLEIRLDTKFELTKEQSVCTFFCVNSISLTHLIDKHPEAFTTAHLPPLTYCFQINVSGCIGIFLYIYNFINELQAQISSSW